LGYTIAEDQRILAKWTAKEEDYEDEQKYNANPSQGFESIIGKLSRRHYRAPAQEVCRPVISQY